MECQCMHCFLGVRQAHTQQLQGSKLKFPAATVLTLHGVDQLTKERAGQAHHAWLPATNADCKAALTAVAAAASG